MKRLKAPYFDAYFEAPRRVPRRFAVVTACNPWGRKTSAAKNRRADAALRRRLIAAGFSPFRVTGGDRAGAHREPGWGFTGTPTLAHELCREFSQDAFYWINADRIYLGSAKSRLHRAGTWSRRAAVWPLK